MSSLKDIAETAGCSISTVSRVLKNKGEIAPGTRKRVLEIADRFGYHDNRLIYGLRTGKTQMVGLICDYQNPFFQRIAHEIENELLKKDYLTIFIGNSTDEQGRLKRLVEQRVDGVILVPRNDFADTKYFNDVLSRGLPVITLDRKTPAKVDFIGTDDYACGWMMAEHFYQLGHRKLGYYAGPSFASPAGQRMKGFQDFCLKHPDVTLRIVTNPEKMETCDPNPQRVRTFLRKNRDLTAIGTFYDYQAYDVCRTAAELGIRIPEDIAVAGVGDMIPERGRMFELTTFDQKPEELAHIAIQRLFLRLSLPKGEMPEPVNIRIKPELIVRKSTQRQKEPVK